MTANYAQANIALKTRDEETGTKKSFQGTRLFFSPLLLFHFILSFYFVFVLFNSQKQDSIIRARKKLHEFGTRFNNIQQKTYKYTVLFDIVEGKRKKREGEKVEIQVERELWEFARKFPAAF